MSLKRHAVLPEVRSPQLELWGVCHWLEVVNGAGEICKLPCTVEIAARWLPQSVVTLCEQLPNHYRVHAAYRDVYNWEGGELLPY